MSTSISIKELKELDPSSYQIVDIRDAVEISHGAIPGALVMKTEEIETSDAIDRSKKTIICCSRGRFSVAAAEELQEKGWDAVSLEGGYIAWLMDVMSAPEEQDKAADVEIYSVNGSLVARYDSSVGVRRVNLSRGIYLVIADGKATKVIL